MGSRKCKHCSADVTTFGGISYCSAKCHFEHNMTEKDSGCWEWNKIPKNRSYGSLEFEGKTIRAHRFSYLLFKGDIPQGFHVCHRCDNPRCVNPQHLFLGTPKQNSRDMVLKGRSIKGKRHFHSHSWQRCEDFFNLWKNGISTTQIGKDNGLNQGSVYYLIKKYAEKMKIDFNELPSNKQRPKFLKYSREQCEKVISLRKQGKTFVEIASLTGVKKSACKYIYKVPDRLR